MKILYVYTFIFILSTMLFCTSVNKTTVYETKITTKPPNTNENDNISMVINDNMSMVIDDNMSLDTTDEIITITCESESVGDTLVVDGITYTKRTASQITPANATTTCTSGITSMVSLFINEATFNGNISNWDVSSVTNMQTMFQGTTIFNQDISAWDVSSVTNMTLLFNNASAFNQDIGDWNVSSVTSAGMGVYF